MHCVFILGAAMRTCVCCVCVVAANVTTVFRDRDWMCLYSPLVESVGAEYSVSCCHPE